MNRHIETSIGKVALAVAVATTLVPMEGFAQETCYRDDVGRIVTRRRPGYVEVPCPTQRPQTQQRVEPPTTSATPEEETGRAPRRTIVERPPPTNTSPFPRPGIDDYCAAIVLPDRWRVVDALGGSRDAGALRDQCQSTQLPAGSFKSGSLLDPYNRNILKADRPLHDDWFFN